MCPSQLRKIAVVSLIDVIKIPNYNIIAGYEWDGQHVKKIPLKTVKNRKNTNNS